MLFLKVVREGVGLKYLKHEEHGNGVQCLSFVWNLDCISSVFIRGTCLIDIHVTAYEMIILEPMRCISLAGGSIGKCVNFTLKI